MKKTFSRELAYAVGMVLMAVSVALTALADFGVSMVVAPAYILHLALSRSFPFFSFGMAEYILQAALIFLMSLVLKKFKISYLFSIVTAVLYGVILDAVSVPISYLPAEQLWQRIIWFVLGVLCCAAAVSMFFHTYISPEAYELIVKEISAAKGININRFKTCYDLASCLVAVVMTILIFRSFRGVGVGTIIMAFVNGFLIGKVSAALDKHFVFKDSFKWRKIFEK